MDITLGQVVFSKAGRDKGKRFIVVSIIDQDYVYISDGGLRKIEKPKKKKIKHLQLTKETIELFNQKLYNSVNLKNEEIKRAL